MNYLHWSLALQRMAQGWITQCIINTDSCDFICKCVYINYIYIAKCDIISIVCDSRILFETEFLYVLINKYILRNSLFSKFRGSE